MKITERMRLKKALEMIEEISVNAWFADQKSDWNNCQEAFRGIYRIVHTIRIPNCRHNHPLWTNKIDDAIRAEKKRKEGA